MQKAENARAASTPEPRITHGRRLVISQYTPSSANRPSPVTYAGHSDQHTTYEDAQNQNEPSTLSHGRPGTISSNSRYSATKQPSDWIHHDQARPRSGPSSR
jgi:hypothetical protein